MRAVVIHAARDLRIDECEAAALGPRDVRVRIEAGGICGSDLHYYQEGRIGTILLEEPMILGHEIAGVVDMIGTDVGGIKSGDRVAVSPSRPCGACRFCQNGQQIHCLDMRFYGSAMRMPHVQGAFREILVADAAQCHVVPASLTAAEAAMAEPLAVCLHAARRAGPLLGKRVLVTGSGPIGALCAIAARRAGAVEVVATDIADAPGEFMRRLGADRFINVARETEALAAFASHKGWFDVLMEASGTQHALVAALDVVRPGGILVQVKAPCRCPAPDYGDAAVYTGTGRVRAGLGPLPRHEGTTRVRLTWPELFVRWIKLPTLRETALRSGANGRHGSNRDSDPGLEPSRQWRSGDLARGDPGGFAR